MQSCSDSVMEPCYDDPLTRRHPRSLPPSILGWTRGRLTHGGIGVLAAAWHWVVADRERDILERAVLVISEQATSASGVIDEALAAGLPSDHPVTLQAKILRLELLKVKADLERELESFSLNCSKCGLDVHWVSGLANTPVIGRTRSQRLMASLHSEPPFDSDSVDGSANRRRFVSIRSSRCRTALAARCFGSVEGPPHVSNAFASPSPR